MAKDKQKRILKVGEACFAKVEDCYIRGSFTKGQRVPTIKPGDEVPEALVEVREIEVEDIPVSVTAPVAVLIDRLGIDAEDVGLFSVYMNVLADMNEMSMAGVVAAQLSKPEDAAKSFGLWRKDYTPEDTGTGQAEAISKLEAELEKVKGEKAELEDKLSKGDPAAADTIAKLEGELEQAKAEKADLETKLQNDATASAEAISKLEAELEKASGKKKK